MQYLAFVDGLRAVAILSVVGFHALPQLLPGGFAGVDVFFVISGFLITRFIAEELREKRFTLTQFFIRRARRLMPAAVVCFVVIAFLSSFVLFPDAYWYFGRSLLASMLMYSNIFFLRTGGYFSAPALEKPLLHTWSLSVEDQFYLTWPLLMMLLWPRLSRRGVIVVLLAIAAASFAYAEYRLANNPEAAFFLLPARAWELLAGAITALMSERLRFRRPTGELLSAVGLGSIVASFFMLSSDAHFPGLGAAPAVFGTILVIAAGLHQKTLVNRLLSLRPMVFTGLISYSLYLWHWPLIALFSYRAERVPDVGEAALIVALSFILATVSWRYVERPFRAQHLKHQARRPSYADKLFVGQAAVAVLAVVSIAGVLKVGKGFPQRYDGPVRTFLSEMVSGNPVRSKCDNHWNIFRNDAVCSLGRQRVSGESYQMALLGDSMADHWTPLLAQLARQRGLTFRQVTNGGCPLIFDIDLPVRQAARARECASYQAEAAKFVAANSDLKLVVISSYWRKWQSLIDAESRGPAVAGLNAGEVAQQWKGFEAALKHTIEHFTHRGIKVLLIGQIPVYGALPIRCAVAKLSEGTDAASCGMRRSDAAAQLNASNAALSRLAAGNPLVSVWLPYEAMCQEHFCSPFLKGRFLYRNGLHLNRFGAMVLSDYVHLPDLP